MHSELSIVIDYRIIGSSHRTCSETLGCKDSSTVAVVRVEGKRSVPEGLEILVEHLVCCHSEALPVLLIDLPRLGQLVDNGFSSIVQSGNRWTSRSILNSKELLVFEAYGVTTLCEVCFSHLPRVWSSKLGITTSDRVSSRLILRVLRHAH